MLPSSPRSSPVKITSEMKVDVRSPRKEDDFLKNTLEEIKNMLVSTSNTTQHLEERVAANKGSRSDEQISTDNFKKLKSYLKDALEKNKQWLDYDQQREAYVRAALDRMLWLEKQLNEANQTRSQQHNEDHSDGGTWMIHMRELYERRLQIAKDELESLQDQVDEARQNLLKTQHMCMEREEEVEELKQQLQTTMTMRDAALEDQNCTRNEVINLSDEVRDLYGTLEEERLRSAEVEFQTRSREAYFRNLHIADQRRIAHLERQIKIFSQDLDDEKQNCLYLTQQMVSALRRQKNTRVDETKVSERTAMLQPW